mgnify:CR=1 FL=1
MRAMLIGPPISVAWGAPGTIGATTPNSAVFTTLAAQNDGNVLTLGSGANTAVAVILASQRAELGYDGTDAYINGVNKPFSVYYGATKQLHVDANGNLRMRGASVDSAMVGGIALKNLTPPAAGLADHAHIYSDDVVPGDARLHIRNELNNGIAIMPPQGEIADVELAATASIDLKATPGQTTLFTVPAGKVFFPENIILLATNVGAVTTSGATITVGANASFNDFRTAIALGTSALTTNGQIRYVLPVEAQSITSYAAGVVFKFNLVTATVSTNAQTVTAILRGQLRNA